MVVVGAGFGGLAVVRGLRKQNFDVTVVDKQNHHLFQPLLYQVATAALSPADIAAPIRTILKDQDNVHVVLDEVTGVDMDARSVHFASGRAIDYDALVLSTGARHSYFGNEAWAAYAPGIKTIDDATRVRRTVLLAMEQAETFRQARSAAPARRRVPDTRRRSETWRRLAWPCGVLRVGENHHGWALRQKRTQV